VRQVVGRNTRELGAAAFAHLREQYRTLVLDLGTGDGKHVLAVARARPDALVIGLDAAPDAMRATSAAAARKPAKGGVPNAVFVWGSAERLPPELTGIDEIHVLMPWGSLLRAVVGADGGVLRAIRVACAEQAGFLITLNLHAWRPPVPEVGELAEPTPQSAQTDLAARYAAAGWALEHAGYADASRIAELGTSWTKRLGSARDELAVLELRGTVR
jgi:predicted RNA methylase